MKQSKLDRAKDLVVKDLAKAIDRVKKVKRAHMLDDIITCLASTKTNTAIDAAIDEEENL